MIGQRTNPLIDRKPTGNKGPVTREQLDELAAKLNRSAFVIAHGWHYHVGQRFIDEVWKAELCRSDGLSH